MTVLKVTIGVFLGGVLLLLLLGWASSSTVDTDGLSERAAELRDELEGSEAPLQRARIGRPLDLRAADLQLSVTAVGVDEQVTADPYSEPTKGRLVAARLQIDNTGNTTYIDYPVNRVRLVTSGGRRLPAAELSQEPECEDFDTEVRLEAGGQQKGCVVFDVPNGQEPERVLFTAAVENDAGAEDVATGQWRLP